MKLANYLKRIQYPDPVQVDIQTLKSIHRHHLHHIPYENIDVQLQRRVSLDVEPIYDKIVTHRRGGWCYEMNGLLAWALQEIGFSVRKLSGGVMREIRGDDALGSHLVLLVHLKGKDYIADVGFGDGLLEPVLLESQTIRQRGLEMTLEQMADGYWRFHNHPYGGVSSFDFNEQPASIPLLESQCDWLQTSDQSPFRRNLVCQTFTDTGIEVQLGRISKSINAEGVTSRILDSSDQLMHRLSEIFRISEPEVANLWPTIVERHRQFFADDP